MPAIESNIGGLWVATQTAKGTPAAAPAARTAGRRLRQVGGGLSPNIAHGSENYLDGLRFNDAVDFVDSVIGGGSPVVQAGPGDLAYLMYLMGGAETVGAQNPVTTGPYPHTVNFQAASSKWFTAWKRVGTSVVLRQKFNDCRMASLRVEGSSANKVVKATPTIISLDPGELFTTDPTVGVDADNPFLYTEAEGTFVIDGVTFRGHSSFALVINDNLTPWMGDAVTAFDLVPGQGNIVVEGVTILVDQDGLNQYNKIVYGSASPAAATKPQKTVYTGTYTFTLKRGTVNTNDYRAFQVTLPKVHWTPDMSIEGNPDGGPVELSLGAEARSSAGNQLTVVTTAPEAAYT